MANHADPQAPEEEKSSGLNISEVAIKHPVTTMMVMLALIVTGLLAYRDLPVELYPDVSFPVVSISTIYPGASAIEMETLVTKPIEDALSGINGIEHINSTSSAGLASVVLQFDLKKDIQDASNEVREKIDLIKRTLPLDAEDPIIARMDPDAAPVQYYALSGSAPLPMLTEMARDDIKPQLQKIEGVADINILGGEEREVQILLDSGLLKQYRLSPGAISARLKQENLDFPSGNLKTDLSVLSLRTVNAYKTAAEIANTPISIEGGKVLLLKDVAEVRDDYKELTSKSYWNGKPAVVMSIGKQSGTNTVKMAHAVSHEVDKIKAELPPGVSLDLSFDTAKFIEESKEASMEELIIGSILAIIVIFFFLRTVRGTLIAAVAIPTSIIATYTFMGLMGFSLNMMSLMALALVVGILVDDAVVDLENIFRHIEMGEDPYRAAINATNEIGLAVVATTLSIVAVFAPVGFMGGIIGSFFKQFGLTVSVAVLVSLLVARTLTPMLSAYFLKPMEATHIDEHEAAVKGIGGIYQGMLRWALKRRIWTVLIALAVFIVAIPIAGLLPSGFTPENDRDEFTITASLPSGSKLSETEDILDEIVNQIKSDELIKNMLLTAGSGSGVTDKGTINVTLKSKAEGRKVTAGNVQRRLQLKTQTIAGAQVTYQPTQAIGSGPVGDMNLSLKGDNLETLQETANQIVEKLHTLPIVTDSSLSTGTPQQEIQIRVDQRRALESGVNSALLASTLRAASLGDVATQMRLDKTNVDIRVRLNDKSRYDLTELQSLPVLTNSGSEVPLGSLATITYASSASSIGRADRQREIKVIANSLPGAALSDIINPVEAELKAMNLPADISYSFTGDAERMKDAFGSMIQAMALAVLFIYMILASQFESFFHPFTIMMALPMAFAGAFLGLFMANKEMSIMSLIGIIMLMGLVVKNSILLIDYTLTLQKKGMGRNESLLLAGPVRLRPILMTTIAMIAGMIPVALQLTVGSESRSPMAVAVIGGLITSTLLTLLVVPVIYTLVDDAVIWSFRKLRLDKIMNKAPDASPLVARTPLELQQEKSLEQEALQETEEEALII